MSKPLLSPKEVGELDKELLNSHDLKEVLDLVGESLFTWFKNNILKQQPIHILVGPGNNGNDGLSLALRLLENHYSVEVSILKNSEPEDASKAHAFYLKELKSVIKEDFNLKENSVVVDALFGIGLHSDLRGEAADWVSQASERSDLQRISIDIPSGVDAKTGRTYSPCFKAHHTLTIGCFKPGLLLFPGKNACGTNHIIDVLPITERIPKFQKIFFTLPEPGTFLEKISRDPQVHKYKRGKVGVVLCESYPGAALMTSRASQISGAGFVEVFCPESLIKLCQIQYPSLVFRAYKEESELSSLLEDSDCDSLVLGPGWDLAISNFEKLLKMDRKILLDGGALNKEVLQILQKNNNREVVLTPHTGELDRMTTSKELTKLEKTQSLSEETKATVVAKGYDTLIYQQKAWITDWNETSLAVAGSGDLLAGIIGSFMAQGLSGLEASCAGVGVHRNLGRLRRKRTTPDLMLEDLPGLIDEFL